MSFVRVLGQTSPAFHINDIGYVVGYGEEVSIPVEVASKSKDLWDAINLRRLLRIASFSSQNGVTQVQPDLLREQNKAIQDQNKILQEQNKALLEQCSLLREQIALAKDHHAQLLRVLEQQNDLLREARISGSGRPSKKAVELPSEPSAEPTYFIPTVEVLKSDTPPTVEEISKSEVSERVKRLKELKR